LLVDERSKPMLRQALIAARARLEHADRSRRSEEIARRVASLDAFARARTIALYAAVGAEVDTAAVARAAAALGKRLAWPRLVPGERALAFSACGAADLVPGGLRTLEPPADAPTVPLADVDLVLVPGVAFDASGRRLGRGRGHYDATLAALPAAASRVGLAFEVQIVPEVPSEPHDALVDAVVTEERVLFRLPAGDVVGMTSR
jgi:5-formyltetrahydrofolate cyclo-ligase